MDIFRVELGLFHQIVEETLFSIVQSQLEERVTDVCTDSFDQHHLLQLESWLRDSLVGWLQQVAVSIDGSEILAPAHLLYYLYDSFIKVR